MRACDWPVSAARLAKGLYWERAWNLIAGCTPISPACDHCWAAREAAMREHNPNPKISDRSAGLTTHVRYAGDFRDSPCFNGKVRVNMDRLTQPTDFRPKDKPIVWSLWTDLFHPDVPLEIIHNAFQQMGWCPEQTFLICTKRTARLADVVQRFSIALPNVVLMTTIENQARANERLPHLLKCAGWRLGLSMEPLLGPVDLVVASASERTPREDLGGLTHVLESLSWITMGGESGGDARPSHPDWFRNIRVQAAEFGIPLHFKQWGEWVPWHEDRDLGGPASSPKMISLDFDGGIHEPAVIKGVLYDREGQVIMLRPGKRLAGRLLDGVLHDEFPRAEAP